ncbi:hypothetical protein ACFWRZ_00600 [Streptomyces rubiginosohelvolus]|uniref:hypothetical protein n=1 Tax=Streptomyces rubiginosohelvolus TaxID=67362 RepID=UPI00365F87C1
MRNSTRRNRVALLLSAAVLGSAVATVPAYATSEPTPDPSLPLAHAAEDGESAYIEIAEGGVTAAPEGGRATRDVKQAYCKVTAYPPHWSKGATSVIYKTRVQCFRNTPTIRVKVTGSLRYYAGKDEETAATSSETRAMGTLGKTENFYTPVAGGEKVAYSANFFGFSKAQLVSPCKGTVATAASKTRSVKVP